jgi:branched-chain amino acid transport system substrate-binding protein
MLYLFFKQTCVQCWVNALLNSEALTKIQSIILIAVIAVAALGGVAAYVLLSREEQAAETIKIGVCADLDQPTGKSIWQGAVLAAEQVNAEGGVLGRNFSIVAEDDDYESLFDPTIASNAFTKLITIDEADFVICYYVGGLNYRETAANHKKILFTVNDLTEELTQHVLDDYDNYKYYFRAGWGNETSAINGQAESIVACINYTGFSKIAFLYPMDFDILVSPIVDALEEDGFDIVSTQSFPWTTIDFSSYFAKAEEAGAEILFPMFLSGTGVPFVKEYYNRQSPMVIWGKIESAERSNFWELTEGKCEHITTFGYPVVAGYPETTKTIATGEAYIERWGEEISSVAAVAYDTVRFILADAIERAGTIETDAVIEALEETDVETSSFRRFVFTSNHDIMKGPDEIYSRVYMFQWQNGEQVPVYPKDVMEEAGASYTFPDWPGPWDNQ